MKEHLTNGQRISAMAATAETINEIREFINQMLAEDKLHYSFEYLVRADWESVWFDLWLIVDNDTTAVCLKHFHLAARDNYNPDPYFEKYALTPSNLAEMAEAIKEEIRHALLHEDELAAEYRAKREEYYKDGGK